MSRGNVWTLALVLAGCIWRGLWLSAGVADRTSVADTTRAELLNQVNDAWTQNRNLPRSTDWNDVQVLAFFTDATASPRPVAGSSKWQLESVQRFDPDAAVWIVSGPDGKPGWDGWDDNQDGTVDDLGELGAAWSDDHCLTPLDPDFEQLDPSNARIINRGTFVLSDKQTFMAERSGSLTDASNLSKQPRWRWTFSDQAASVAR
ncbi:putative transmembrane protein [Rhodopirellula islandica]|uniref:Transmembrane protein n=1 Tax=Rhodopirellula islandica TaxID=595434 RepID=A0A0J1B6R1_RHOIS|nr:hypothetical protein [Rhodopirellula islandica]KLU02510.1 putative transmembrane protein [Rhodopirellula islandica]